MIRAEPQTNVCRKGQFDKGSDDQTGAGQIAEDSKEERENSPETSSRKDP
jgi:hypothetical protein